MAQRNRNRALMYENKPLALNTTMRQLQCDLLKQKYNCGSVAIVIY